MSGKLLRNTSDSSAVAFWSSVQEIADSQKEVPAWMKAGIDLNDENFKTFGPSSEESTRSQRKRA